MIIDEEEYLEHFGVKGMHWGVRKERPEGVSREVNKHAMRDAQEFARAKAFYGQGAGTRRKLIKATVEGKSKRMPGYEKAFNFHLANQDPSKHAEKAQSERHKIDRNTKNKQRGSAILRRVTHEPGTQAALVAAAAGGAAYLNSPRGRAHLSKAAHHLNGAVETVRRYHGAQHIKKFL